MPTERLSIQVDEKGAVVVSRNIDGIGKSATQTGGALQLLKRTLGLLAGAAIIKQVLGLADTFTVLQNKLKIVTTGSQNLGAVTNELFEIAKRTRSSFEETANSYSKFALSAKELGVSQKDVLEFTELVNKAVIIGGSAASEAAGGLRQLAQGIASGALRGDELISVLENLPFVADTIAKGLGVTRGELRDLGKEGKITAEVVLEAFKTQADFLNDEYAKTVITVGQSLTLLSNSFLKLVGAFDESSGATSGLAQLIVQVSEAVSQLEPAVDSLLLTFRAIGAVLGDRLQPVVDQFREWGITIDWVTRQVANLGLFLAGVLRTALMVLDDLLFGTQNVANVVGVLFRGLWDDIGRGLETAALFWEKLFRDVLNTIIRGINAVSSEVGIDPIGFILPEKDRTVREAFDWAAELAAAVEGGAGPLTTFFDDALNKADELIAAQRQIEVEAAKTGQEGVGTEGGVAAAGIGERKGQEIIDKTILGLERERTLLTLSNDERERRVALFKLEDALAKEGQELQPEQKEEIVLLIKGNQELARRQALLESIKGPQREYVQALADLEAIKPQLTLQEYNTELKRLEETQKGLADPKTTNDLGNQLAQPFRTALNALTDFTTNGRIVFGDFVADILTQIARIAAQQLFTQGFGALGLPGFATGADFTIGGQGGPDSQVVAFRGTPGERVRVETPGQQAAQQAAPVAQQGSMNVKVVNIVDPSMVLEAMESEAGEKVVLNHITNNRTTVRKATA